MRREWYISSMQHESERTLVVTYLNDIAGEAKTRLLGLPVVAASLEAAARQIDKGAHLPDGWMRVTQRDGGSIDQRLPDAVIEILSSFGLLDGRTQDAADAVAALDATLRRLTGPTRDRIASEAKSALVAIRAGQSKRPS